jgi:hypothetical protein
VSLGPCMYWIQNSRTETRTLFGFCLYQGCFIPPPIVSVLLPLMFLKTKNKKMTDDAQKVCSAGVPWPGHYFFLKVWPVTDVTWRR